MKSNMNQSKWRKYKTMYKLKFGKMGKGEKKDVVGIEG